MVFSDEDKAIIKHYHKKGYTAYRIWNENKDKNWKRESVARLIKRYVEYGTMERRKGSDR